jgi:FtsP/CotA-like multicopper oxidase with cupredoxin domain
VREAWELVNLATENHNFHVHQTKFRAVDVAAPEGSPLHPTLDPNVGAGVMEDEASLQIAAPVPAIADQVANDQNGYCTVQQWIDHECLNVPKLVDIPFAETGEFVYHCHILEHEDAGMMAKIQVIPAAPAP